MWRVTYRILGMTARNMSGRVPGSGYEEFEIGPTLLK